MTNIKESENWFAKICSFIKTCFDRPWMSLLRFLGIFATIVMLALAICHTTQLGKVRDEISELVTLNSYPDFDRLIKGIDETLKKVVADTIGKSDILFLALDFVGYGHFSYTNIYYGDRGIYNNLVSLSSNQRVKIITLDTLSQRRYLEEKFIPPLVKKDNRIKKLKKKLEKYLEEPKHKNALGDTLWNTLDSLVKDEKYLNSIDSARLQNLLIEAILKTESFIQNGIITVIKDPKVISCVDNLPIDFLVYSSLNIGIIAMHTTKDDDTKDYHGIRIQNNEDAIRGLRSTWDELAKGSIICKEEKKAKSP